MAIQRDGPVHIGIDNQATGSMCNAIKDHHKNKREAKLKNEWGGMIIGGTVSPLQRSSQSKRPWSLYKEWGFMAKHRGGSGSQRAQNREGN